MSHRDLGGEKNRFGSGSEMCDNLVEKMAKHSRRLDECSPRRFEPSALQRRGGVPLTHGRGVLRQRKPLPLAPCACPVRASAPSRLLPVWRSYPRAACYLHGPRSPASGAHRRARRSQIAYLTTARSPRSGAHTRQRSSQILDRKSHCRRRH